jgi:geranylgeranyl diphosphate synthase type II
VRIANLRAEINAHLENLMPEENRHPVNLHAAMRYSLLGGGKRVRALLCLLVSEAAQGHGRSFALDAGCAVEMVHAASLIIDDLPCMDDAKTRRGRPAAHVRFGEATSILAAFGLLNRAFGVIGESAAAPGLVGQTVQIMSQAIGSDGMIAGQEIDLNERTALSNIANIEALNWLKTGSLFVASGHIGALAAESDPASVEAVKQFARHIGLAFQTADDLIDQTFDTQTAGKDVRQDGDKPTILSIAGEPAARASCKEHIRFALEALETSGLQTESFVELVESIFGQLE